MEVRSSWQNNRSLASRWCRFAILAVFCLQLGAVAHAQSTSSLSGEVTDPTGATIPNATVAARNVATGVERSSQTDSAGAYLFPSLPIGAYHIEVSASGFRKGVIEELKLDVATAVTKDIQLEVGQMTQQVEINADAAVVETSTTGLGQVINDKTVQEIQLNGRHFTDLSLLTVGTVTPPQNGFLSAPLRGQGSFGINTAGQREDTTNWLVNGINLNDPVQNQITFQPPIDTLAEAKIDNSSFPAQYGRNSGAIVNMATRSGMTVSEDHTFGATLTNTVRLGYNRIHLFFTPNALLSPADFDITEPAGALTASGLPFFNISGNAAFSGPTGEPQGRGDTGHGAHRFLAIAQWFVYLSAYPQPM